MVLGSPAGDAASASVPASPVFAWPSKMLYGPTRSHGIPPTGITASQATPAIPAAAREWRAAAARRWDHQWNTHTI
eukprot:gene139-biopygen2126